MSRAASDEGFRARLAADPRAALDGWHLSADDLRRLIQQIEAERPPTRGIRDLFDGSPALQDDEVTSA